MEQYQLTKKQEAEKRIFDIILSIIAIVITSPIMLFIAIAIKIDGKGRIIYKQKRITKSGKEFTIYKFRTMVENAEKETWPVLAKKDDNRITRIGKVLRKTRLDELPQFFNVLKGDMSIVGPRPERREIIDEIIKEVPKYKEREQVKAGITCIAHIKGDYYTEPELRLEYDKEYMKNWSIIKDIKIIFKTLEKIGKEVFILKEKYKRNSN